MNMNTKNKLNTKNKNMKNMNIINKLIPLVVFFTVNFTAWGGDKTERTVVTPIYCPAPQVIIIERRLNKEGAYTSEPRYFNSCVSSKGNIVLVEVPNGKIK